MPPGQKGRERAIGGGRPVRPYPCWHGFVHVWLVWAGLRRISSQSVLATGWPGGGDGRSGSSHGWGRWQRGTMWVRQAPHQAGSRRSSVRRGGKRQRRDRGGARSERSHGRGARDEHASQGGCPEPRGAHSAVLCQRNTGSRATAEMVGRDLSQSVRRRRAGGHLRAGTLTIGQGRSCPVAGSARGRGPQPARALGPARKRRARWPVPVRTRRPGVSVPGVLGMCYARCRGAPLSLACNGNADTPITAQSFPPASGRPIITRRG